MKNKLKREGEDLGIVHYLCLILDAMVFFDRYV